MKKASILIVVMIILCAITVSIVFYTKNKDKNIITYTDTIERKVELPKTIEKVICLNGSLRYYNYLGNHSKVVLASNDGAQLPYMMYAKEVNKNIEYIDSTKLDDLKFLQALKNVEADVILINDIEYHEASELQAKTKTPVIVLTTGKEETINSECIKSLDLLANIFDAQASKDALVQKFNEIEQQLKTLLKDQVSTLNIYYGAKKANNTYNFTSTTGRNNILTLANANNVINKDELSLNVDVEEIISSNPDIIVYDQLGTNTLIELFKNKDLSKRLHELKAFKENYSYTITSHYKTGLDLEMMYINAYFIATLAHPELEINLQEVANNILKEIYNDKITFDKGSNYVQINSKDNYPLTTDSGWLPWV